MVFNVVTTESEEWLTSHNLLRVVRQLMVAGSKSSHQMLYGLF
jgi:hypothetical protein